MRKFIIMLLFTVFFVSAAWSNITTTTNTVNENTAASLVYIQDWSPPIMEITITSDVTTSSPQATIEEMLSEIIHDTSPLFSNNTNNVAQTLKKQTAEAVVQSSRKLLPSLNRGDFMTNSTANDTTANTDNNTASTTARRINADKWIIFKLC